MSDRTKIEWADSTWNPVTGCVKVPGSGSCQNCYASTLTERFRGTPGHYSERGFDLTLRPERLDQPLRWRRPRRVFVNSPSAAAGGGGARLRVVLPYQGQSACATGVAHDLFAGWGVSSARVLARFPESGTTGPAG